MCLVDDRAQLVIRIMLGTGRSGQRHDTAGAADLDELGAVFDLVAHRAADLVDAVGDALLDRQVQHVGRESGEHRRVEMPTGGCNRMSGRHNAGAVDPSGVDGLAQRHVEQVATGLDEQTQVPHGGEPRAQGAPGIADGAQHPGRRVVLHLRQPRLLAAAPHQQIDLHVHQPGQQDLVAQVKHRMIWARWARVSDTDDAVTIDPQDARRNDFTGIDVQ